MIGSGWFGAHGASWALTSASGTCAGRCGAAATALCPGCDQAQLGAERAALRLGGSTAQRGQASVELVAMIPLAVVALLAALQLLAAGATRELAGHAAGAGAVALLQRADARDAARDAVPGWSRTRIAITVSGPRVTVRMRPPTLVPGLAGLLESTVRADAGQGA